MRLVRWAGLMALAVLLVYGVALTTAENRTVTAVDPTQPTPTPYLIDFEYAPVVFGAAAGPTVTPTRPPATLTPYATLTPSPAASATVTPTGQPTATPTATSSPSPSPTSTATDLPVATPTMTPLPTPSTQAAVVVANHTLYDDRNGRLQIFGELENLSNVPIEPIKVEARFLNKKGRVKHSDLALTYLSVLAPGERTCFSLALDEPARWKTYDFAEPVYDTEPAAILNLDVLDLAGGYDELMGWFMIRGQVRNNETITVSMVRLVATLYDKKERVMGCDFSFVDVTDLGPGETGTFEIIFANRDYSKARSYLVQVEGQSR